MERTQPHACGSPAPALTLGPKRTWRNGRRSRLQLECPRGNPRRRTAQIRGTLQAERPKPIPSQARLQAARDGVETRRGAPKAKRPRRRDSPDHERPFFKGRRRKPKRQENLLLARECGFESRRPHQGARQATSWPKQWETVQSGGRKSVNGGIVILLTVTRQISTMRKPVPEFEYSP